MMRAMVGYRALALMALTGCTTLPALPPAPRPTPPSEAAPVDPPLRPLLDIPYAEARTPFADEESLFRAVREAFVANGFEDAQAIKLAFDDVLLEPTASASAVTTRHFLGDGAWVREHMSALSKTLYQGKLEPYFRQFDDERQAFEAYHTAMSLLVAHELARALAMARGAEVDDERASRFEWAVLGELVRLGRVPARWIELYKHYYTVMAAAAPAGALADAAKFRLELAKQPAAPFRELVSLIPIDSAPVHATALRVARAVFGDKVIEREGLPLEIRVERDGASWTMVVVAREASDGKSGRVTLSSRLPDLLAPGDAGDFERVASPLALQPALDHLVVVESAARHGAPLWVELVRDLMAAADGGVPGLAQAMREQTDAMAKLRPDLLKFPGLAEKKR